MARSGSLLCVGLDPDLEQMPRHVLTGDPCADIVAFNREIIAATRDLVCAYKPNLGFYVAYGLPGLRALIETRELIDAAIPVILDCKIGDFANTSAAYARGLLDDWGFDAITISPYMGEDGLAPLMSRSDRAVFVLCKTSNPGSGEFQDLLIADDVTSGRLYERVARRTRAWHDGNPATVGLVVGATWPEHLRTVRALCPDQPILLPGIGAQQGDIAAALDAGLDANGRGLIPTASRSVLYAGSGPDFAAQARQAALRTLAFLNAPR
jgi:orotidine-5'-phosphate decarboxylase